MKLSCEIIRDILPLYAEGLTSHDTNILVEKHIEACVDCKKELESFQKPNMLPMDTDIGPFKKIERKLFKKDIKTIALTIFLVLAIVIIGMSYITSPEYLPYSKDIMALKKYEDGTIIITFDDEVAGYDIERYNSEDGRGYNYHLTTWNTIWNQYIIKNKAQSIILNPDGEDVVSVYYFSTDGREDRLIYGKNLYENGGVVTLPRLVLGYYRLMAILMTIILGVVLFICRKKPNIREKIEKIFLLSLSYIIGHFCIKGFKTTTYLAKRDFFAILLVMIPTYGLILLSIKLIKKSVKSNP